MPVDVHGSACVSASASWRRVAQLRLEPATSCGTSAMSAAVPSASIGSSPSGSPPSAVHSPATRVRECVAVRACVRACVCVCVRARARVSVCVCVGARAVVVVVVVVVVVGAGGGGAEQPSAGNP